jgi:hypothetical protein
MLTENVALQYGVSRLHSPEWMQLIRKVHAFIVYLRQYSETELRWPRKTTL